MGRQMSLTEQNLTDSRSHLSGEQRIYRVGRYGLSLVNSPMLHAFPFAWAAAVLDFGSPDGKRFNLTYDTPLTSDVEVFDSEAEAVAFIERAFAWFAEQQKPAAA